MMKKIKIISNLQKLYNEKELIDNLQWQRKQSEYNIV